MKYNIITIEREYASGGREIGNAVSEKLGIPRYGTEILQMTAERKGTSPEYLENIEETATNSLLYSLFVVGKLSTGENGGLTQNDELIITEAQIIRELTDKENCIIIGRCAGSVLSDRQDVLNVFIHAGRETRIKRAVEQYGIPRHKAEDTLKKFDRRRSNYYKAYSNMAWDNKSAYHMILDSGKLGIMCCADLIAECYKLGK